MPADFNRIAGSYDLLSGLVFGKTIRQAQIDQLAFISEGSVILIVGGGTGWILEELTKVHASGLNICYIDSSSKMIALAAQRNIAENKINFIRGSIEEVCLTGKFDVIITPFLFDMFLQDSCYHIITKLKNTLKLNGFWLYSDFCLTSKSRCWQKIILRSMYLFFRLSCHIEAKKLPEVEGYFSRYKIISDKKYLHGFICGKVFKN